MKRNFKNELEGLIAIAKMVGKTQLVVKKASTNAGISYPAVEMIRGNFEDVETWCYAHQNDHEFQTDYVSQYQIMIADEEEAEADEAPEVTEEETMEKKWYAVQKQSSDDWDTGSFDFEEAKTMLKKQGFGLIAVIVDDFCEEEIKFDDLFYLPNFEDEELAAIVRNADDWTDTGCVDAMAELCNRAGNKLHEMVRDGVDCSEYFKALRSSDGEYLEGTPDVSDDTTDLIDWLWHEAADRAESIHLCYALQDILNVDLGI